MSTGQTNLRLFFATLAVTLASLHAGSAAQAGCLDWLFGRPSTYTAGYPYAPYAAQPYAAQPYTAQYAGVPTAVSSTPIATYNTPMANAGVVQAQRPAYGSPTYSTPVINSAPLTTVQSFNNPSVYSGLPVNSYPQSTTSYRLPINQTPAQVPIASALRGNAAPLPLTSVAPSSSYTANYPSSVAPVTYNAVTYNAVPYNAVPSTQVLPLNARPRWRFGSGLSRFFNSLLGRNTNYTTSYYTAPVTYYRPVTSVDPVTGTTVTVQRPCTSYAQQLQRVPYNSFLPANAGTVPIQTVTPDVCSTLPLSGTPGSFAPPSTGIGQVGGQFPSDGYGVSPIPSTIPESGYSNTAPLTGATPAVGGSQLGGSSGIDPADAQNIPQPQLRSERPNLEDTTDPAPSASESEDESDEDYLNDYYDDLYPYGDRPAIQLDPPVTNRTPGSSPSDPDARSRQFTSQTPPSLKSPSAASSTEAPIADDRQYSTLRPIGIPSLESAPGNTSRTTPPEVRQPAIDRELQPPPLPVPSSRAADPSALFRNKESTAASRAPADLRVTVPIREATTRRQSVRPVAAWEEIRQRPAPPVPAAVQRDNSGWKPVR